MSNKQEKAIKIGPKENEAVFGRVATDLTSMTLEELHTYSTAPDFNKDAILQSIVERWKKANFGSNEEQGGAE